MSQTHKIKKSAAFRLSKERARCFAWALVALVAALCCSSAALASVVSTDLGTVEGRQEGGVISFKGIPYAAPPVGELRWRAPQPMTAWGGVRQADKFAPDSLQVPDAMDVAPSGSSFSEDCLYLNIWHPAPGKNRRGVPVAKARKFPVMVWLHGGAYVNGGSSAAVYDGSGIARHGVVLVSVNYRLGRLGFFAHPALAAAQEPYGNFAYMDMIAALQWVKRNISSFAGDASRITVVGESAGGDAVMHLLTSPKSKELFHRAIVMSGSGRNHMMGGYPLKSNDPGRISAEAIGVHFAQSVGIMGDDAETLRKLRALPAEKVIGGINLSALLKLGTPLTYAKGPIEDGDYVLAPPGKILRDGWVNSVPLIIGTTDDDLPTTLPGTPDDPLRYFGAEKDGARAVYDPNETLSPLELLLTVGVDVSMHEPARFVSERMTRRGSAAWLYRFSYVAESQRGQKKGASHASELPFLFDTLSARYGDKVTERDIAAGRRMRAYFMNFIAHGNPNAKDGKLTQWLPFAPDKDDIMNFSADGSAEFIADPLAERLNLVERVAEK